MTEIIIKIIFFSSVALNAWLGATYLSRLSECKDLKNTIKNICERLKSSQNHHTEKFEKWKQAEQDLCEMTKEYDYMVRTVIKRRYAYYKVCPKNGEVYLYWKKKGKK